MCVGGEGGIRKGLSEVGLQGGERVEHFPPTPPHPPPPTHPTTLPLPHMYRKAAPPHPTPTPPPVDIVRGECGVWI